MWVLKTPCTSKYNDLTTGYPTLAETTSADLENLRRLSPYAEASRGLNQLDAAIDAACEKILLDLGRVDEAYEKYALTANGSSTGLTTFRAISKKYPGHDPKKILLDLATSSGEPGRWFAAAKDASCLDLALEFAKTGRTDPRTLSRASRDLVKKDARFCLEVGRLAVQRILEGYGYELTGIDVLDAFNHYMAAAQTIGIGFAGPRECARHGEETTRAGQ